MNKSWAAYAKGEPFLSDAEFDALAEKFKYEHFTEGEPKKKANHLFPMYSLNKVFDDEPSPLPANLSEVESAKLDGAAISLKYEAGILVQGCTRGDGIEGEDITEKCYLINSIPKTISSKVLTQIKGEIVVAKGIENARNFASGALHIKSNVEFARDKATHLIFVAYGVEPFVHETYKQDMYYLEYCGFITIMDSKYCKDLFRTDGTVFRVNDNAVFKSLGYTAKHPRGAYARKLKSDVAIEETVLLDVIWDTGRSGAVTPVAIFEEVVIDDAKINRATLHNAGFLQKMELEIGDLILVTRSGGVIPKVLGKA